MSPFPLQKTAWLMVMVTAMLSASRGHSSQLGMFSGHTDIGRVASPGTVTHDATNDTYVVGGGGENMWFASDAFHFVWKRESGHLALAADVRWLSTNGNSHRKACLIIRQSLEPDSPYADVAVHGDGLTSLQYREIKGGPTREIQSNIAHPPRIRLEKRDHHVSMSVSLDGVTFKPAGGSFRLQLAEPFYVGLGVCAHDRDGFEVAEFSRVELSRLDPPVTDPARVQSTLEFISIVSKDRRVIYHTRDHIEAPNWSRDGQYLIYNSNGRIYRLPLDRPQPELVDTGFAIRCNNDHGISPDGRQLVISDQSQDGRSRIYTLPIQGGTPKLITPRAPSYWHGWSPDGRTLVYCAERDGEFDVYSIPATGGEERRLTTAKGLDDGPDYSPNGQYIFFNSERSGSMQIWRMNADGSNQVQWTDDQFNNWFPHPSPDGRWIVFLSYASDVKGHPANKDVMLRLMPASGGDIEALTKLYGGQGTINVPSWAPDSQRIAFVSYQPLYP